MNQVPDTFQILSENHLGFLPYEIGVRASSLHHNSRVYLADCMDLLRQTPDKYYHLCVVDPPYGINAANMQMGSAPNRSRTDGHGSGPGISTAAKLKGRLNSGGGKLKNKALNRSEIGWDNEIPDAEYFAELSRVSKNLVIWGGNYFPLPPTRCILCWNKLQPWENFSQFELAWTSFDKPAMLLSLSNTGGANSETKIHPTQKPVKLYQWIYRRLLPDGGKVLDTHLGSGSNRIAADMARNIDFTGYEIGLDYYASQEKRWQQYKSQLSMF